LGEWGRQPGLIESGVVGRDDSAADQEFVADEGHADRRAGELRRIFVMAVSPRVAMGAVLFVEEQKKERRWNQEVFAAEILQGTARRADDGELLERDGDPGRLVVVVSVAERGCPLARPVDIEIATNIRFVTSPFVPRTAQVPTPREPVKVPTT
jgi:hypothetical protein